MRPSITVLNAQSYSSIRKLLSLQMKLGENDRKQKIHDYSPPHQLTHQENEYKSEYIANCFTGLKYRYHSIGLIPPYKQIFYHEHTPLKILSN